MSKPEPLDVDVHYFNLVKLIAEANQVWEEVGEEVLGKEADRAELAELIITEAERLQSLLDEYSQI